MGHGDDVQIWGAGDVARTYRWPQADDHKYSRGVLGLLTGSESFPGAAVLSSLGALHTGLGMLRHLGDRAVCDAVLAQAPETVIAEGRTDAWALGSGVEAARAGEQTLNRARTMLGDQTRPAVVDAGALALIDPATVAASAHHWVLTPHAGEFVRTAERFGVEASAQRLEHDRHNAVRELAEATHSVVLLKGAETLISDGTRMVAVRTGTPWHATAGTGDVLTGAIGAVLAGLAAHQAPGVDLLIDAAATGAWLHGQAGRHAPHPFTPVQLARAIPFALTEAASRAGLMA